MEDDVSVTSMTSNNTTEANANDLVLVRIGVPELSVEKCMQFQKAEVIWEVKQQALAALPKVRRKPHFTSSIH